jgi:hypothetical protein
MKVKKIMKVKPFESKQFEKCQKTHFFSHNVKFENLFELLIDEILG